MSTTWGSYLNPLNPLNSLLRNILRQTGGLPSPEPDKTRPRHELTYEQMKHWFGTSEEDRHKRTRYQRFAREPCYLNDTTLPYSKQQVTEWLSRASKNTEALTDENWEEDAPADPHTGGLGGIVEYL